MKFLTWTDKMLIQKMMIETLERAFDRELAQGIYHTYSEVIFREVESSEWFQDDKDILTEHIEQILGLLINDAGKFMFEGEFKEEQD